ncbi:thiamine-phosphate synthase [Candidatus Methanoplasma termitum]|uniref:ThiE1 protein n=1 Tax=Candidatus Methanoplasma termitum TaxID=1577791 RepID=A0A0A7LCE8_9ARCH|nr:thiamine phosphate synthase [Candidatus Methanoplasma termitum]AIZ55982.1 thiamine-phosphate synthase [Candidatus Methanoplasma termitum]MCL2334158.1 thiamine phosphate synthase [Candidatus Methanoplasma sp.]
MIIAVTDRKTSMLPFGEQFALIAKARPDIIILSERDMSASEYKDLALSCKAECDKNGVEFCIDKFFDVAKELGVKTVYVSLGTLREEKPEGFDKILTSVHNEKEAQEAERRGATLLIFQGVFDVNCKACRNAKGLAVLRYLLGSVDIPVVGAGGIMPDVFLEVLASDTAGVCMKEGFMRTRHPDEVVSKYREAEKQWQKMR